MSEPNKNHRPLTSRPLVRLLAVATIFFFLHLGLKFLPGGFVPDEPADPLSHVLALYRRGSLMDCRAALNRLDSLSSPSATETRYMIAEINAFIWGWLGGEEEYRHQAESILAQAEEVAASPHLIRARALIDLGALNRNHGDLLPDPSSAIQMGEEGDLNITIGEDARPEDLFLQGILSIALRKWSEAHQYLTRAVERAPGYLAAEEARARALIGLERPPEARQILERTLQRKPDHLPSLLTLAALTYSDPHPPATVERFLTGDSPGPGTATPAQSSRFKLLKAGALIASERYLRAGVLLLSSEIISPADSHRLLGYASSLTDHYRPRLAEAILLRAISIAGGLKPVEPKVRRELARTLSRQGKHLKAARLMENLTLRKEATTEDLLLAGEEMLESGDLPGARSLFEQVLEKGGSKQRAEWGLGLTLGLQGRKTEARHYLRPRPEPDASVPTPVLHTNRGRFFLHQGDTAQAVRELRLAIAGKQDPYRLHYHLARAYLKDNQAERAEQELRAALEINPDYLPAHILLGESTSSQGREKELVNFYQDLVQACPASIGARFELAVVRVQGGLLGPAEHDSKYLRRRLGELTEVGVIEGLVASARGEGTEAVENLRRALGADPTNARLHSWLADALVLRGRMDRALQEYQSAVSLAPDLPDLHYRFARTLMEVKEYGRAARELEQVSRLYRTFPANQERRAALAVDLGRVLWSQGKLKGAEEKLTRALSLKPTSGKAHYFLGRIAEEQGKESAALRHYRAAVKLEPGNGLHHYSLGMLLVRKGQPERAAQSLSTFVALEPEAPEAQEVRQLLGRMSDTAGTKASGR